MPILHNQEKTWKKKKSNKENSLILWLQEKLEKKTNHIRFFKSYSTYRRKKAWKKNKNKI